MKTKRFLALFCVGFSLLLCVGFIGLFLHQPAQGNGTLPQMLSQMAVGNIANGQPVFGNTSAVLSVTGTGASSGTGIFQLGTGTLSLGGSNSASTFTLAGGTGNIPCYNACLTLAGTGATNVLIGSTSSSCTYPIYLTPTSGTVGVQYVSLPQITNINQVFVKLTGSSSAAATADVELLYNQ